MTIVIGLNQSDFVCLRDKIPNDSLLRRVFKPWQNDDESGYVEFKQTGPGIPLIAEFQIHCSKEQGPTAFGLCKKALSKRDSSCQRSIGWADNMKCAAS